MRKFLFFGAILSLHLLCFPQDLIQLKDGKTLWANNTLTTDSYIEITLGNNSRQQYPLKDIVLVEYLEGGLTYYDSSFLKIIDEQTIKAPYFKEGDNVYIPFSSTRVAQRCGSIRLRELVQHYGYWNVVNSPLEAHFILEYVFNDNGADHAYLLLTSRDENESYQSPSVRASDWIPQHAGQESAEKLFRRYLMTPKF